MQQEDDLRGLAKVMEFMRAISIIFIVIHNMSIWIHNTKPYIN